MGTLEKPNSKMPRVDATTWATWALCLICAPALLAPLLTVGFSLMEAVLLVGIYTATALKLIVRRLALQVMDRPLTLVDFMYAHRLGDAVFLGLLSMVVIISALLRLPVALAVGGPWLALNAALGAPTHVVLLLRSRQLPSGASARNGDDGPTRVAEKRLLVRVGIAFCIGALAILMLWHFEVLSAEIALTELMAWSLLDALGLVVGLALQVRTRSADMHPQA